MHKTIKTAHIYAYQNRNLPTAGAQTSRQIFPGIMLKTVESDESAKNARGPGGLALYFLAGRMNVRVLWGIRHG